MSDAVIRNEDLPPWAIAAIDQRVELLGAIIPFAKKGEVDSVITPLTEPPEDASKEQYEKWDRACDNCGRFVPEGEQLMTGHCSLVRNGVKIIVTFGACQTCMKLP